MSITLSTSTITNKERTNHIEIITPVGETPLIRVFREKVWEDEQGNIIRREDAQVIAKSYEEISKLTFGSLTGEELYALIAGMADAWSQE